MTDQPKASDPAAHFDDWASHLVLDWASKSHSQIEWEIIEALKKAERLGREAALAASVVPPDTLRHGIDCQKVIHRFGEAYLHRATDDAPFDVDGLDYCGRCHAAMTVAPLRLPPPQEPTK